MNCDVLGGGRGGCEIGFPDSDPFCRFEAALEAPFIGDKEVGGPFEILGGATAADGGEFDPPTLNLSGGSFGSFASASRRLQSLQMKWNSSFSASSCPMPRHLLCCHTLHLSHATL